MITNQIFDTIVIGEALPQPPTPFDVAISPTPHEGEVRGIFTDSSNNRASIFKLQIDSPYHVIVHAEHGPQLDSAKTINGVTVIEKYY